MHKPDANHAEIRDGLRAIGAVVADTAAAGFGFPDLVVGYQYRIVLLEVKDGRKPPSARRLTDWEIKFHRDWHGYPVYVVNSFDEALEAIGATP